MIRVAFIVLIGLIALFLIFAFSAAVGILLGRMIAFRERQVPVHVVDRPFSDLDEVEIELSGPVAWSAFRLESPSVGGGPFDRVEQGRA